MRTYNLNINNIDITIYKKKRVKNFYIKVKPPKAEVIVVTSYNFPNKEIQKYILQNMDKIIQMREKVMKNYKHTQKNYKNDEEHYLFGEKFILELIEDNSRSSIVKKENKIILKIFKDASIEVKEKAFNIFYKRELDKILPSLIRECESITGLKAREYRIKNMKTRWGSCNIQDKRVWINLNLAKKPIEGLKYVLIHELVHLIEKNHTKRFYDLVQSFYPNYKEVQKMLNSPSFI